MSRWRSHLFEGEAVHWEGRPAPRAFTFRNWRWSARVLVLYLSAAALAATIYPGPGVSLPSPAGFFVAVFLVVAGFWGTVGHLFYARLLWEREFYALTDRRLLVKSGLFGGRVSILALDELAEVFLSRQGPALGTITVQGSVAARPVILYCLEHPELLLKKLPGCKGKN